MTNRNREAQERFGANVEGLRQRRGMSVEALAKRSQLGQGDLAEILSGEAEASANSVYLLAGALGVEPDDLFKGMSWTPPADGGSGYAVDRPKRR
ncbi:MAG TPA: helix-turn-helix transcriptional regulator [Solirubrobacterales bacterium]|nr:helix-turn-helix transcriptional regulator [Solirubrobacterales bacterium]